MKPLALTDRFVAGELFERAMRNFDRLEQEYWRPDTIFRPPEWGWPGDHEGRTVLALTLLAQALHRTPRYLEEIMERLPGHLNEKSFFGKVLIDECDEQQLSSHGWVLRGLCEYYRWKNLPETLAQIQAIVENLVLPASKYYDSYPTSPEQREMSAGHMGELQNEKVGNWYSSTDIGCAFIMLDGVVQAYQITEDSRLIPVIDKIVNLYLSVDFEGLSCQTHATLSGLRGVLRYYEMTGTPELLESGKRIWALYVEKAMTDHYANHNWFSRPQLTEPCAIVDSYMVATTLWRLCDEAHYLDMAHHILYNAFYHGQRSNGGFGCDSCVGADSPVLELNEIYEAWWCCTMRAGEGFYWAISNGYFQDGDTITVPFYGDSTTRMRFSTGSAVVVQRTRYPKDGRVLFEVLESTIKSPVTFKLFVPEWAQEDGVNLTLDGQKVACVVSGQFIEVEVSLEAGQTIKLDLPMALRKTGTVGSRTIAGHSSFRHGPLVLGCEVNGAAQAIPRDATLTLVGGAMYRVEGTKIVLGPTGNTMLKEEDEAKGYRLQVLFKD